jgi:hypothetical protein
VAREAEENRRRVGEWILGPLERLLISSPAAASRPTMTPGTSDPLLLTSPAPLDVLPSKPTTHPPTPQEVKPRYPPDTIASMSPRPSDPPNPLPPPSEPVSKSQSRGSDPSLKQLPQERKSLESLPRSRAPSDNDKLFDDLPPPPEDDDLPPEGPPFPLLA